MTGRRRGSAHAGGAQQYLEGRHYEEVFSWPEQGLEVYLVGRALECHGARCATRSSWHSAGRHSWHGSPDVMPRSLSQAVTGWDHRETWHRAFLWRSSTFGISRRALLRPLLEAEGELWRQRLHWDYRTRPGC